MCVCGGGGVFPSPTVGRFLKLFVSKLPTVGTLKNLLDPIPFLFSLSQTSKGAHGLLYKILATPVTVVLAQDL